MPAVKGVGEPCAGEPHARIEVAAGGNRKKVGIAARNWAPPADPTEQTAATRSLIAGGVGGRALKPFRGDELAEVRERPLSSAEGETDERRKRLSATACTGPTATA